jgi:hypothetical protein
MQFRFRCYRNPDTREQARGELVDGWDRARQAEPGKSRIILTHTNAEVQSLNGEARDRLRVSGDLGDDVTVKAERGTRQFATGDRIMFLRNERGMGVKNGTLATIERVSAEGMGVRLDDGRGVAFDTKDYAHVDYGYAATFHKSQGVTVDRAHILATPGMDRHSAYVGMSRHRDNMQLHYGRDDFADQRQLVRALSRDRGKDMAGDYAREGGMPEQDQARAFADRREIRFPERARQVAARVRDKARGMFDGFRPKPAAERATSSDRAQADRAFAPSQARAIERYGRAAADIGRMKDKGLPVLAHQEQALAKAGDALDQTRPHAARDLASAIERNPRLARDAAEGNTRGAAKAMETERQVRIDPEKRAGRFVEQWQGMKDAQASMERAGDRAGAEKLGKRMESIAGGLHRDPQLESVLQRRAPELALSIERGRSIGQELAQSVSSSRDRDRDRGMSR